MVNKASKKATTVTGSEQVEKAPIGKSVKKGGAFEYLDAAIEKQNQAMSKEELARLTREGRAKAARRKIIKSKVFHFEQNNYTKLVVFSSGDNWYKMGGNSALIYVYMVAPQIGVQPKLRPDKDFYDRFVDGVVSVRDLNLLIAAFSGIGIKLERIDDDVAIFDLGRKVSKAELEAIRDVKEEHLEQVNQIVKVNAMYPAIVSVERRIARNMRSRMLKASPMDREMILTEMAKQTLKSVVDIFGISNNLGEAEKVLKNVHTLNERMKIYVLQLMELGIFDVEECLRTEQDLVEANTLIAAELKKLTKTADGAK